VARYNEILVGRFNRFAQKYLSMKGPASLAVLNAELAVHHPLQNGAENRYLEGWDLFGVGNLQLTPGVGNTAVTRFRNPVGSNVVAILTRWQVIDPTPGVLGGAETLVQILRGGTQVDENTTVTGFAWDSRGRPSSTCIMSTNSAAAAAWAPTGSIYNGFAAANAVQEIIPPDGEITVLPGTTYRVAAGGTNTALNNNIWWRERFLEDSERA